ncbi:coiled-coil domain-containing protein 181-like isoform X2 [Ostrea edulis]|uniref:coiled-coil domain-containing protein 181-like isoform X2 n=1 Tax=Ostrea edulis TaxID=37623 RepID=UPI0024AF151A|nr:coiled-coil domain-containing protein 181-like isoform X2 [Ostrea edulis]
MTTMESPQIQVTSYDDTNKKVQDDDDDLDKELESFIATRTVEERKENDDNSSLGSQSSRESEAERSTVKEEQKMEPKEDVIEIGKEEKKEDMDINKEERKEEVKVEEEMEKMEVKVEKDQEETEMKVEKEEKMEDEVEEKHKDKEVTKSDRDTDVEVNSDGNDSRPSSAMADRREESSREKMTDDEDSEPDDYTLTEDQKRALKEIEYLKSEMGLPEEDPPEYDVKERLKTLNEELANDPTPVEKSNSKVNFKANLVDLVAPPPDYPDEETPRENSEAPPQSQASETSNGEKENGNKVLIERDGKFELVSENDVRAKEMGLPVFSGDEENVNNSNTSDSSSNGDFNRKPAPPSQPRPATANGNSRRTRPGSSKQRASSAGTHRGAVLGDFNYNSPYAMSPKDKKLVEEQTKQREQRERDKKKLEQQEKEYQERDNNDAFQAWLRQKREESRARKQEEEEKKKSKQSPRQNSHGNNSDMESYESLPQSDEQDEEVKEAYSSWLKSKQKQLRQEKLLKKREEMESTDGFYIRSRQECDQAFRQWIKKKSSESRKARFMEQQQHRLSRLAARKTRKNLSNLKAMKQSNSFVYVDYYGYRY